MLRKGRATPSTLKHGGELRCSRRVSSFGSANGIRHVAPVTNPVIHHDRGKDRIVIATFSRIGEIQYNIVETFFHLTGHLIFYPVMSEILVVLYILYVQENKMKLFVASCTNR